jgi:hypothetical protein
MSISISIGVSNIEDSFKAGHQASLTALQRLNKSPSLAIIFVSIHYDQDQIIKGITSVIDKNIIIGASSYAEISNLGVTYKSVVIFLCTMDNISLQWNHSGLNDIQDQIAHKLLAPMNLSSSNLDQYHSLGLLFRTAGEPVENELIQGIKNRFSSMMLFGGMGAGDYDSGIDNPNYWKSYMYINGTRTKGFDGQMEILPKGVDLPITIYDVKGISGKYHLCLPEKKETPMVALNALLQINYLIIKGKDATGEMQKGTIRRISKSKMDVQTAIKPEKFSNVKIHFLSQSEIKIPGELYGKVVDHTGNGFIVHFTSMPAEIDAFINGVLTASV